MGTRQEILQALRENPDGLTSKELAPLCPSAECDEMIVGRIVGQLRAEEEIHATGFARDGATVYKLGAPPRQEEDSGPRITLPETGATRQPQVSAAALAIAAMRQPKAAAGRAPNRVPTPATTPAPAPAAASHSQETAMMSKSQLLDKISAAPEGLRRSEIEKLAGDAAEVYLRELLKDGLIKRTGHARGTRYLGKGAAPVRKLEKPEKKEVKKKALRARSADRPPRRSAPPATPPETNGKGPHFAINEHGELGIEADQQNVKLAPEAFARLREFIERTKPVWEGAGA